MIIFRPDGSLYCIECNEVFWPLMQEEHCPHRTNIQPEVQRKTALLPNVRRQINSILEKEGVDDHF